MTGQDAVAIVFAGGLGSRMIQAEVPKQFIPIQGKPVLVHTLEHFQHHPEVGAIYLSCLTGWVERAWELVTESMPRRGRHRRRPKSLRKKLRL